jgi:hypothetical protein
LNEAEPRLQSVGSTRSICHARAMQAFSRRRPVA